MTTSDEDLARAINADFDRLAGHQRQARRSAAIALAQATAFAAIAFLEQAAGRGEALALIGDLIDA